MENLLAIIILEIIIKFLPTLNTLAELLNSFIAIGIQKCDSKIRKIAMNEEEIKEKVILGFSTPEETDKRNETFDKN